jgi:adenosylhomocysteine nucleosidase
LLRIIVTFAVRAEFAPWRRMRNFIHFRRSDVPKYFTEYGRAEVWVLITGIGTRNAHAELRRMLAQPTDACVVCGLAGSLKRQHAVGTVLAAKAIKRSNTGTIMSSEDSLVKIAAQHGATPVDFFYTSDAVVSSASEKSRLGETADAVDMESFQVMTQASLHGVPAIAVRAVSDAVDRDVPLDFNRAIDEQGEIGRFSVLSQVAAAPWRLPQMIRFGFESSKASRNLAHFLDRYLNCLAADAIFYSDHVRWEAR